jgi:hypothetical protein
MTTPEIVAAVVGAAATLALYVVIEREEAQRERTATDELWARTISDYRPEARSAMPPAPAPPS